MEDNDVRDRMQARLKPEQAAMEIWQQKYTNAKAMFLSGSVLRGEATIFSDLDLVVIFEQLDHAWRESFYFQNWPVEVFIHDASTLNYFFYEMDAKSGCPSLPQMVAEGIVVSGTTDFSDSLKQLAQKILDDGPASLSIDELNRKRYSITDLLDDLRDPRSTAELIATGSRLFEELADFYFRSNGLWSASGKMIIRKLQTADTGLSTRFESAFRTLFSESNPSQCVALAEEILSSSGGLLFDGYRLDAPASWKLE